MDKNCNRNRNVVRGVLAGAAGGLVASWVMNVFIEGPGHALQTSLQTEEEKKQSDSLSREEEDKGGVKEDATMKAADALVEYVSGRHLSLAGKQKGGPVVHYGFGTLMGGLYGGCAELTDAARAGFGTAFGTTLFVVADMVAVPALHLSAPSPELTASTVAPPLAAHLVYGATTELIRRALRATF